MEKESVWAERSGEKRPISTADISWMVSVVESIGVRGNPFLYRANFSLDQIYATSRKGSKKASRAESSSESAFFRPIID
jgi:hypothetical protein